jgi:hypothetical protein
MKTNRETNLETASIVAISLAVVLLLSQQTLAALAVGAVAVILFIAASNEVGHRLAAEKRAAERESEARRKETEERERLQAESERIRCEWRDADSQDTPYEYECVGHPNRTLALRYGISNHASAEGHWQELRRIKLRKLQQLHTDEEGAHYLAELPAFGNRQVRVVIQPGTDYVKTFYPMSKDWFERHKDLEMILKDNPTFTLKELATFHVQAVLNAKR